MLLQSAETFYAQAGAPQQPSDATVELGFYSTEHPSASQGHGVLLAAFSDMPRKARWK